MKYEGKLTISYGYAPSNLERLRSVVERQRDGLGCDTPGFAADNQAIDRDAR